MVVDLGMFLPKTEPKCASSLATSASNRCRLHLINIWRDVSGDGPNPLKEGVAGMRMQEGLCWVRTFIWLLIQAAGLTIVLFLANLTNFSWYLICQFADHDTPSIALSLARLSWSFSIFPFADHYTVYNTVSSIHPQFFSWNIPGLLIFTFVDRDTPSHCKTWSLMND